MPTYRPLASVNGVLQELTNSDTIPVANVPPGLPLTLLSNSGALLGHSVVHNGSQQWTAGFSNSLVFSSSISADVNNLNFTNIAAARFIRVTTSGGFWAIRGINATANTYEKTFVNVGTNSFYLAPEHSSATEGNRILHHEEVIVYPGAAVTLWYDQTSSRWRVISSPSDNYFVPFRSKWHDVSAERVSTAVSMDQQWDYWGSITLQEAAPTSQYRYNSFLMNTGAVSSGGAGIMLVHDRTTGSVWAGSSHIILKTHIVMPANLSEDTNHYYYFARLAAAPYSGFFDQNNTVGFYYRHTVNGGRWFLRSRDASGAESNADSGVTVVANGEYELLLSLNRACTEATFFINGSVVGRLTTNLPSNVGLGWSQQLEKVSGTAAREVRCFRFTGAAIPQSV